MVTWLLDGNVLVALAIDSHEFHHRARRWFDAQTEPFATCAITEGTLLRVHMRLAVDRSTKAAWNTLESMHAMEAHEFWVAGFSYRLVSPDPLTGWADVTDAWLAELARQRSGRLATLDAGLVGRQPDVAVLVAD